MAKDDMEIIIYKILSYLYECAKNGVHPEMEDICYECKLFRVPESYWKLIMREIISNGYITGINIVSAKDKEYFLMMDDVGITLAGREYLCENSGMKTAEKICGKAFEIVLEAVIGVLIESQKI